MLHKLVKEWRIIDDKLIDQGDLPDTFACDHADQLESALVGKVVINKDDWEFMVKAAKLLENQKEGKVLVEAHRLSSLDAIRKHGSKTQLNSELLSFLKDHLPKEPV